MGLHRETADHLEVKSRGHTEGLLLLKKTVVKPSSVTQTVELFVIGDTGEKNEVSMAVKEQILLSRLMHMKLCGLKIIKGMDDVVDKPLFGEIGAGHDHTFPVRPEPPDQRPDIHLVIHGKRHVKSLITVK